MEILAQTDERLVLQDKPVQIWDGGKICLMIGLLPLIPIIFCTNVATKLSCDRSFESKINCTLERYNTIARTETLKISEPQAAKVIPKKVSGRNITHYQVVISTPAGEYFLLPPLNDEPKHQQIANTINQYITSQEKTLQIKQDQWEVQMSTLAFFFFVNLILIPLGFYAITLPEIRCTFDKNLNKVIIERQSIRHQQILKYPLNDILRVDIQSYGKAGRLVLVLISQQQIPIHNYYIYEPDISQLVENIKSWIYALLTEKPTADDAEYTEE